MSALKITLQLLVGWAFWPGSFFLVGLIGESRLPPLWRHQSKAFFPGDLALPVMLGSIDKIVIDENLLVSGSGLTIGLIAMLAVRAVIIVVATKVRHKDLGAYGKRDGEGEAEVDEQPRRTAANSPTKVWHDIVGYYIFPLAISYWVVYYAVSHIENGVGISRSILWVVVPLVFYILCVAYDCLHPASEEDMHLRHPEDWKPIWETMSERHPEKEEEKRERRRLTSKEVMGLFIIALVFGPLVLISVAHGLWGFIPVLLALWGLFSYLSVSIR